MNDCEKHEENLTLLAAGCLADDDLAALKLHLAECATCRTEFNALKATCNALEVVAQIPATSELPPEFNTCLAASICGEQREIQKVHFLRSSRWKFVSAAACVAVVVSLATALQSTQRIPRGDVVEQIRPSEAPTVLNLQRAMQRSDEALFEMLDRQAEELQLGRGISAFAAASLDSL